MTSGDAGLIFSRAGDGDWDEIWPLWREVVRRADTYAYDPATTSEQGRAIWLLPPPAQTWVARSGGEVVGTYLLKPNQPGQGDHVANAGFMVDPRTRGRGVGRTLAEHCLDQARAAGYRAMQFNAVVASNAPAVRLWTDIGFGVIGRVPGGFRHPVDGPVDLLIMYREL